MVWCVGFTDFIDAYLAQNPKGRSEIKHTSPAETRKGMILTTNNSYKHLRNVDIRNKR